MEHRSPPWHARIHFAINQPSTASRYSRRLLPPTKLAASVVLALTALSACKPASEPARGHRARLDPLAAARATEPSTFLHVREKGAADPAAATAPGSLPPVADSRPSAAAEPDSADVPPDGVAPPEKPTTVIDLEPELIAELRRVPDPAARDASEANLRLGLKHHRKLEIDKAIKAYNKALKKWPGSPAANYNLACAMALRGDAIGAVDQLRLLTALEGEQARDKLAQARVDKDFETLRDDESFRELTGYVPLEIAWNNEIDAAGAATQLAVGLRKHHLPARRGKAWNTPVAEPTIYYRKGDVAAEEMARLVIDVLDFDIKVLASRYLSDKRPLVVVLTRADQTSVGKRRLPTAPGTLEAVLGERLEAKTDDGVQLLEMKSTGFFSWELHLGNGQRIRRTGRYHYKSKTKVLHFSYRQTTETPGTDPLRPDVEVELGRRSTHPVRFVQGGLVLEGTPFLSGQ